MSEPALQIEGLSAGYDGPAVIRGVGLRVEPGEAVALLGRNGAGKTTTLMAAAGVLRHRSGSVRVGGEEVGGLPSFKVARHGLSLVPQGRRIFPTLTVRENLVLAAGPQRLDLVEQLFPVLAQRRGQPGTALSGGEQQMLAVARALMTGPRLLLLDEPSEGLAPQVVQALAALFVRLRHDQGIAILIAEQNLRLALEVADRVYVLERGEIVHAATVAEFRADPSAQRRYLGV